MNQHDIYDILNKLRAVENNDTLQTAAEQVEKLNGVKSRLDEKYMGFEKTAKAVAKNPKVKDPEAVAAAIGRKKYGKAKFQKAAAAGKKLGEASKPDFLDLDKDGNKKEPMKSAAASEKKGVKEAAKPDFLDLDKDGNKKEPMKSAAKTAKVKESMKCNETPEGEKCPVHGLKECGMYEGVFKDAPAKSKVPAFMRKAKAGKDSNWKVSAQDLEHERSQSPTGRAGLEKAKRRLGQMTEGLGQIMNSMARDVQRFKATGNLSDELYSALYDYYVNSGEMPYGVAKARTGDPYDWIISQLETELGIDEGNLFTGNLAKARAAGLKKADLDGDGDMEKVNELDLKLIKAAQKHAKENPSHKDPESERNIHKKYGHRSDRDDTGNDDDYDEFGNEKKKKAKPETGEKRGRGRPKKYTGDQPRKERVTAKSRKADRTAHGQADFKASKKPKKVKEGENEGNDLVKLAKVIRSCRTPEQLEVAKRMANNFLEKHLSGGDWTQMGKDFGMQNDIQKDLRSKANQISRGELDEKAVSKAQQRFMGMAHAMQKGEKIPGASKELKKVASTMKKGDVKDFAKTKHAGLPEKKKKTDEMTTTGGVAPVMAPMGVSEKATEETKPAAPKKAKSSTPAKSADSTPKSSGGMQFGKGIYDSLSRQLDSMIAEGMQINASMNTGGDQGGPSKTLTVTATDESAEQLMMLLKMAGLDAHGGETCPQCGQSPCGCDHVEEDLANSPDEVTVGSEVTTQGLAGGLNKPKSTGQTTVPVISLDPKRQGMLEAEQNRLWKKYRA